MRRGKSKDINSAITASTMSGITNDELNKPKNLEDNSETKSKFNLNEFRFQKKTHIKIEFEKSLEEERKGLWEPPNWKEFLLNLKNMRSNNDAPVDTMGCHMAMDENAAPEVMRYQSLIALMLSSQTKDQVTFAAMERLRSRGLTVDNVLNMSEEELGQLIYPVGFWKTKVKYIKKTTLTLKELYNGDIPDTVEKLCKLTGVGPKMAHICMKVAWNKVTGIGVDTHVHRISNRIGWVKKPTATPEETRKALEAWLPFKLWSEVNHLMVGFGQTICSPVSPNCNECLNSDICPSSEKGRKTLKKSSSKRTPVKVEIKAEEQTEEEMFEDKNQMNIMKQETSMCPQNNKLPKTDKINTTKDMQAKVTRSLFVNVNDFQQIKSTQKSTQNKKKPIVNNVSVGVDEVDVSLKRKSPQNKADNNEIVSKVSRKKRSKTVN